MFVSYLLFSHYYQTTEGEKKAATGLGTFRADFVLIAGGLFSTVVFVTVYVTGEVKEMIAMTRPGSDEEIKSLEKAEKFAYHTTRGGRNGTLGRKSE